MQKSRWNVTLLSEKSAKCFITPKHPLSEGMYEFNHKVIGW